MLPIVTGYDVTETLCETTGSLLLRTGPVGGRPSTILKLLNKAYPSPQELARFRQEYEITRRLDAPGVIKVYGLETYENSLMILMEDIGGESLSRWLQERTLDLETFLSLAVRITETLGDIHSASIIHKDISCSNIIWNATTDELRIIDFGVSTRMSRANSVSGECETRDGTLAYMSPERTGLMNRGVDYRTDFYSLGVTFYEMLTGRLPFSTNDTVELVHCHIARTPPRPNSVNSPVPVAVSEIVMKLMAKEAADRYQSAKGIQADLEYALAQLRATQHIDEFELGRQDYCSQLNVSQTLYGRTGEVKILQDSFRRVAAEGRPEMVLVAGYSGVGKTSLVREIHRTITESRGLFAAGKFDQFNRNIPYSAVVQAFQGLVQQLLAEPTERVDEWRRVLLEKLDTSGQLIVDVIPDVEFLIGPQPAVPPLGPTETQNRFNRVFQDFVSVFSHKLHPLALFLDDLQWADAASLQLLRVLLGELGTCHLLVMGAYRDNEVGPTHPLLSVVDALETENIAVNTVVLQPLAEAHIAQLLSDTLSTPPDRVHSLCQLLLDRTGGNPFFLNQFLVDLYDADLLNFDRGQMAWVWQIDQINADKTTDNVVERLILKIGELPADTRESLRIGSCIGSTFDLWTLSMVSEQDFAWTYQALWPAVENGLLLPTGVSGRELQQSEVLAEDDLAGGDTSVSFRFLHDRVQQAAYSWGSREARPETHLNIGRLLFDAMNAERLEHSLFEVVNHLNQGCQLIESIDERRRVAELNLRAARKARLSSAHGPALQYITTGIDLLPGDCGDNDYSFALSYWLEKGEIEYLNAKWDDSLATLNEALDQTADLRDRCAINEKKSTLYRMKNDLRSSLNVALVALSELGIDLEAFPDETATRAGLRESTWTGSF